MYLWIMCISVLLTVACGIIVLGKLCNYCQQFIELVLPVMLS